MGGLETYMGNAANASPWDHIGVIVRDMDPKNDIPYILEATRDGVKLRAFDERVLRSKSQV